MGRNDKRYAILFRIGCKYMCKYIFIKSGTLFLSRSTLLSTIHSRGFLVFCTTSKKLFDSTAKRRNSHRRLTRYLYYSNTPLKKRSSSLLNQTGKNPKCTMTIYRERPSANNPRLSILSRVVCCGRPVFARLVAGGFRVVSKFIQRK